MICHLSESVLMSVLVSIVPAHCQWMSLSKQSCSGNAFLFWALRNEDTSAVTCNFWYRAHRQCFSELYNLYFIAWVLVDQMVHLLFPGQRMLYFLSILTMSPPSLMLDACSVCTVAFQLLLNSLMGKKKKKNHLVISFLWIFIFFFPL